MSLENSPDGNVSLAIANQNGVTTFEFKAVLTSSLAGGYWHVRLEVEGGLARSAFSESREAALLSCLCAAMGFDAYVTPSVTPALVAKEQPKRDSVDER